MNASTRSISLVLLGSAVFLAGCRRDEDEENRRRSGYVPRVFVGGSSVRSGGGTSSASSTGASARGGFGGTGSGLGGGGSIGS